MFLKNITKILVALALVFTMTTALNAQDTSSAGPEEVSKPIYFARAGCPHCAKVNAFLEKHNIASQVDKVETLNNAANIERMDKWFNHYQIPQNQRGVPFLVIDDSTYYSGSDNIINYLAQENDIEVEEGEYESSASDTVFLAIGGLLILGVLGYGVYSAFANKK